MALALTVRPARARAQNFLRSYQADIFPKNVSAAGFALTNGFGVLGGVIGPLVTGQLRQTTGGYLLPIALNAALVFASGALIVVLQLSSSHRGRVRLKADGPDVEVARVPSPSPPTETGV